MSRRAFTLLELLVVIAIMGMLGTAATAGYFAAVESMAKRGAREAVGSIIQAAQQRAASDRTVTAVYFYNQLLNAKSASSAGEVVGCAVAVRATGRLSGVKKPYLIDEFTDLECGRPISDQKSDADVEKHFEWDGAGEIRLFLFDPVNNKIKYSTVYDAAEKINTRFPSQKETMVTSGGETNILRYAFKLKDTGSAGNEWRAGSLYGAEIANTRLPVNMIFGSRIPSGLENSVVENAVNAIFFKADGSPNGSTTVEMSRCRANSSGALAVYESFKSKEIDKNTGM